MVAKEPMFNASVHGLGFEGFLNYANVLVDGALVTIFMIVLFIIMQTTFYKSKYGVGVTIMYNCMFCLLASATLKLFTTVNELLLIAFAIGIAVGVIISFIERR